MSDFLHHSSLPKISWPKAVSVPTASSIAPGPPSQPNLGLPKPRTKVSNKLAAQLENFEPSSTEISPQEAWEGMDQHNGSLTAETLAEAASRGDIDDWDPMSFDHKSRTFNSYEEGGLGAVMQNCQESGTKTINLFVNKIPAAVTKDGLRNLFSRAGKVNRVFLQKAKTGQSHTFGFVEFGTIKDASTAIQQLNNYDMGNGTCLVVKVAETPEQKEARVAKQQQYSFFSSRDSFDDDITDNTETNPLLPRYNSLAQASPEKPRPAVASSLSAEKAPLGGAASLKASPPGYGQVSNHSVRTSKSPSVKSSSSSNKSSDYFPCHVCSLRTLNRCAECKTPYCSRDCQRKDWSKHQSECKLIQHGVKPEPHEVSPIPRTPPPEESKGIFGNESDGSYDDFNAENDEKLKALMATIRVVQDGPVNGTSEQAVNNFTDTVHMPPSDSFAPSPESEIFQSCKGSQYKEAEGLSLHEILTQFDTLPEPLPSIPLTASGLPEECPIIIVSYLDASHFSAVLATAETKQTLLTIKSFGDNCSSPVYLDSSSFSTTTIYGYKDRTGTFYRAKIAFRLNEQSAVADLYDTGFRAKLPLSSFFQLPEEITSIPCLRKCCSLNHIKPKPDEIGGVKLLMSLVDQKPVLMADVNLVSVNEGKTQIHCCNIYSLDKQTDISEEMTVSQFCTRVGKGQDQSKSSQGRSNSSFSKPFTSPFKSPQVKSDPLNQSPDTPSKLLLKTPQTPSSGVPPSPSQSLAKLPFQSPQEQTPCDPPDQGSTPTDPLDCPYRPVHMASKVLFHLPPLNEMMIIVPKVITSPSIMWAQVMHKNFSNYHNMQSDLNSIYQSSVSGSYAPCVGEMCIVKYSQDQSFYRAEVLCVNHNGTIDVRLVDVGNCETVSTEQLHYMRPQFRTLPKQALLFSLAGVKPPYGAQTWSDAALIFVKDKILNRRVQVTILSGSPATFYAEVYDLEDPSRTINSMLVERSLASAFKDPRTPSTPTPTGSIVGVSLGSTSPSAGPHKQTVASPVSASKDSITKPGILPTPESNVTPFAESKINTSLSSQGVTEMPSLTTPGEDFEDDFDNPNSTSGQVVNGNLEPTRLQLQSPKTPQQLGQTISNEFTGLPTPPLSDRSDSPFEQPPKSERTVQQTDRRPRDRARGISNTELTEGTTLAVTVTHVTNPNSFWVQLLERSAVDTCMSMYKKIKKRTLVPLSSVSAGDLCLCYFSEDKQVHRARVTSIDDRMAKVMYLDYGNSEDVPINELYEIDGELLSFKQQGILCTNNNLLNPAGKSADWGAATDLFKEMTLDKRVEMKVIKCMGLKHVVDVFVKMDSGKRKMLDLMVEEGLGARSGGKSRGHTPRDNRKNDRQSGRSSDGSNKNRGPTTPQKSFSSPFKPKAKDSLADTTSSSWGDETGPAKPQSSISQRSPEIESPRLPQKSAAPSSSLYPNVSTLKVSELQGEADVIVTEVCDPRDIVIQPANTVNAENLDKLSTSLSAHFQTYSPPANPETPPVGALCCANFSQDQLWYRAQVLKGNSSEVKVYFIDYGNTETVSAQSITPCPKHLVDVPVCAVKCTLSGIASSGQGWSPEARKYLTTERILQAKVSSAESGEGIRSVQLFDSSSGSKVDIAAYLIEQGFAVSAPGADSNLPQFSDVSSVTLPSSEIFQVVPSEVISPSEMYVQLATNEMAVKMDDLSTKLNAYGSKSPSPLTSPPSKGSLCCAQFSADQCWYRAEVLSSMGTKCEVRFIDFGNKDTVDLKNLTSCPEELLSVPCLATRCGLAGVQSPSPTWPEASITFFKKLTCDTVLQATLVSADPIPFLRLRDASDPSKVVAQQLIQQGYAVTSTPLKTPPKSPPKPAEMMLPMTSDLKKVDLPTGVFQLMVSEAVSPAEMYIQLGTQEMAGMLDKLSTDLQGKLGSPLASPPKVGSLCCAQFSADQCWYRAEVLSSMGTRCEVRFIDYGNKDAVDLKNMTACPEELLSVPCLATRCGLAGVQSPSPTWPEASITFFKKLTCDTVLQATLVSADPIPLLRLRDASDPSKVVAQQLIQQGYAVTSTPLKTPPKSPPKPADVMLPMTSDLKKVDLPTGVFQLMVSEAVSPAEMYIQLGTQEMAGMLDKLSTDLQGKLGSPLASPPKVGSLCCVQFSADQCWYRAEVLSSMGTRCEVRFIDYGNKDAVDLKNMTACPEELLSVPCLATRCGLAGVQSPSPTWSEASVSFFKQLTCDRLLEAKVASTDPIPLLKLRDANNTGLIVSQQMIQQGHAVNTKSPSSSLKSPTKPTEKPLPIVSALEKVDLPTGVFQLMVSEVVSPAEMYIQLATQEMASMLDKLSVDLQEKLSSSSKPLTSPPSKGSLCCAQFSADQCWYRAEVLSSMGTRCEVRFIDYGNKDTVDLKNMTACPEELLSVPCLATRCGLAGVQSPSPTWSEASISFLKGLVSDKLMKAKVVSTDPIPLLKLKDANDASVVVVQALIQQGHAIDLESPNSIPVSPPKATEATLPMTSDLKKVDLPTGVFQLMVSEAVSPAEMYIQLGTQEMAGMLDKLSTDLQGKLGSPLASSPKVGSLCCAQFSADQCWYRAEVLSSMGTKCEVRFIDYGNKDTVDLKNMTSCPEELLSVPCLATRCGLDGVQSPSPTWSEASITFFKEVVGENLLKAKLVSTDPVPMLKLKNGDLIIAQQMIQQGLAVDPNSPSPSFAALKQVDLPTGVFQLVVSEAVSPAEMYIQLGTQEVASMLDKLSTDLQDKFSSATPKPLTSPPSKGSLCCAQFSADQCWYRAEVLSSMGTKCEVRFIDYGNKDTVDLKNMTSCPEELLSVPCLATRCGLAGVQSPRPNKETWPEESISYFKELVREKLLKAKVVGTEPSVGKVILLKLKDGAVDIGKELLQRGCAQELR